MVTFSIRDPRELDRDEIDRLWRIRTELCRVRPDIPAEEDRLWFAEHLRAATWVALVREGGETGGFYTMRARPDDAGGQTLLRLSAEFVFALPPLHATLAFRIIHGLFLAGARCRHPGLPMRFSAFCYLPSFLAMSEGLAPLWILGERDVPAREAEWMRRVAETEGGADWDPLRQRLRMRTIPAGDPRTPRRARTRSLQERYLRRNPEWGRGFSVLVGAPCGLRSAAVTASNVIDQWVKRWT